MTTVVEQKAFLSTGCVEERLELETDLRCGAFGDERDIVWLK
jgi:hypothetical protein